MVRAPKEKWKPTTGTSSPDQKAAVHLEQTYLELIQVKDGEKRDCVSSRKAGKRRTCPSCDHTWIDYFRKDECPKCMICLSAPRKRAIGESSTFPQSRMRISLQEKINQLAVIGHNPRGASRSSYVGARVIRVSIRSLSAVLLTSPRQSAATSPACISQML